MKKTYKIVMLFREDLSNIILNRTTNKLEYSSDNKMIYVKEDYFQNQHLYILSDEEIKEGNWFTNKDGLWQHNGEIEPEKSAKKVIASTDVSLNLPTIPQSYIEYYIEEYNKGNILTKIELELNSTFTKENSGKSLSIGLKLQNNEVCPLIPLQRVPKIGDVLVQIKEQSIEEAAEELVNGVSESLQGFEEATGNIGSGIRLGKILRNIFIRGARYQASKMYSHDDIFHALAYGYNGARNGIPHEKVLENFNKVHRKPYNKIEVSKRYSEKQVLELLDCAINLTFSV